MKKIFFIPSSTKENTGTKNANSSHALLLASEGYADEAIAERVGMCPCWVAYMRQRRAVPGGPYDYWMTDG
jgi:hypothetical protein